MKAVIQAGGKGMRLRPYTQVLPKPLMPIAEMPVIELLLKWLRRNGIEEVYVTIGYLGHLIRALCGDGRQWDMKIEYSEEKEPMGTIGPLKQIADQLDDTFLVLNGDLITDLDLKNFVDFHRSNGGMVTVATTTKTVNIDLGVLEKNAGRITAFFEKPKKAYTVSMGLYCMEPDVLDQIPKGVPFGFDNLMHRLLEQELPVYAFDHQGCWLDIGREEDFRQSSEFFLEHSTRILGG